MTTKEVLDNFYQQYGQATVVTIVKTMIDKPFLYEYEKEINTQLIDMDEDQLIGLIDVILHHRQKKQDAEYLSMLSYNNVRNALYMIFESYISIHPMRNPFRSAKFTKDNVRKILLSKKKPFSMNDVNGLISTMRLEYGNEHAEYLEMLMLLFYSGFKDYMEIVGCKQEQLNPKTKTIALVGRTITLTDRCFYLLQKFNSSHYVQGNRYLFYIGHWHGGLFPYALKESLKDKIADYDEKQIRGVLNQQYAYYVLKPHDLKIHHQTLFYLGIYDRMVARYGLALTLDMIYNTGDKYPDQWSLVRIDSGLTQKTIASFQDSLLTFVPRNMEEVN